LKLAGSSPDMAENSNGPNYHPSNEAS